MNKKRILVAEHEPFILFVVSESLKRNGFNVTMVEDGEIALSEILCANSNPFDLLITDIGMPVMNGTELVSRLSKLKISLPVVIITGNKNPDGLQKITELGVRHIIKKPFSESETMQKISAALSFSRCGGTLFEG